MKWQRNIQINDIKGVVYGGPLGELGHENQNNSCCVKSRKFHVSCG